MTAVPTIGLNQHRLYARLEYWLPSLIASAIAGMAYIVIGHTPLVRAGGLALIIFGMALALRPMGALYALIGALTFAFCSAFWSQTGGGESLPLESVILVMLLALVGTVVFIFALKKPTLAIGIGIIIFAGFFFTTLDSPRSLRLTTLLNVWSIYLLIDGLLRSNPRPDTTPLGKIGIQHTYGLLLFSIIGILNDPLYVLMCPAILLGLFLTNRQQPVWYWLAFIAITAYGVYQLGMLYADSAWWLFSAGRAQEIGIHTPFLMADGWREPSRWVLLINIVVTQFSVVGLLLGVVGLSRLARWYPPIGVITMILYGTYSLFGLMYFGRDNYVLLLPLHMIQIFWITYAIYTFSQWLQKSAMRSPSLVRWVAPLGYILFFVVLNF